MLTHHRLNRCTARASSRGGFTLVELLVVIGIIAILAGVALGPITNGLRQARHNAAMQQSRQVGQMCFSYATDNTTNGNRYPGGAAAFNVANVLITGGYATDSSIFYVSGQTGVQAGASGTALASTNVSFCFTQDTTGAGTGLASCGDSIPLVFFNNGAGTSPVSFPATIAVASNGTVGTAAPQGKDGMALFYKGNNAVYIKADTTGLCVGVIPASNTDTFTYTVAP